jgi:hypothetical protein
MIPTGKLAPSPGTPWVPSPPHPTPGGVLGGEEISILLTLLFSLFGRR